jgi:hypothetical protein
MPDLVHEILLVLLLSPFLAVDEFEGCKRSKEPCIALKREPPNTPATPNM